MYRTLAWGTGDVFFERLDCLKYFEIHGSIKISAITSNTTLVDSIAGIPFVAKKDINKDDYDIVIVMSEKYMMDIISEAYGMGFAPEQVVSYRALDTLILRDSHLERYMELKKNVPTIFSLRCWGGLTYNSLGLEFVSPFVNLFLDEDDFLKFLHRPEWYLEQPVEFCGTKHEIRLHTEYPVGKCGDIEINFNHDTSFESAVSKWERRKKRINWNNIMAVMDTEKMEIAEEFDKLDYEKKICFTNFKSNLKSAYSIEFTDESPIKYMELWNVVNQMASGGIRCYDPVELLLTGRLN